MLRQKTDLVARDMDLARAFYQLKLDEIAAISHRLALDPVGDSESVTLLHREIRQRHAIIDQQITNKISVLALGGTHLIVLLDAQGNIVTGRVLSPTGELSKPILKGNWSRLPIVQEVLARKQPLAATEIIPAVLLSEVRLDRQASIALIETPLAAPEPFDSREGTAGLAMTGAYPLRDQEWPGVRGSAVRVSV